MFSLAVLFQQRINSGSFREGSLGRNGTAVEVHKNTIGGGTEYIFGGLNWHFSLSDFETALSLQHNSDIVGC